MVCQYKPKSRFPLESQSTREENKQSFASDSSSILKWTLNRAEQAKNTTALLNLAEVNSATNAYKPLRPSQILQSEKFVSRIMEILKEEYVNPFDVNLTQGQLVNLSSGVALPDEMTSEILSARSVGEKECEKFCSERLESNKVKFQ